MTRNPLTTLAVASATLVMAAASSTAYAAPVLYRSITIDGVKIAYRETGSTDKPTLLLLHGVPSSSRMYDGLMQKLGDQYHMVAPDYPGFGNSDAPSAADFSYTFDHLAQMMLKFTDALHMQSYVLFMQDYGAPVGMRLAMARPSAVHGTIFQNGNVYAEGLGPMWEKRKAFWKDRAAHEQEVRKGHLSLELTRTRHLGSDPNVEAYNPDLWMDEFAYLNRPGQAEIQADLIYDYQSNIASYPLWQKWLRDHGLPALVIWGKYDLAFTPPGAEAFKRDLPDAKIFLLDAGHFAMDTRLEEVSELTDAFMQNPQSTFGGRP
ncbi:alpha/beta hydrolase [Neorhizobium sp. P12A]|uniref:alpha/beta fold hydrolase n=1 Tax=Neorhizobium sp. P12A TaxID=2268027 RepID=UPI0011ECF3D4|nr:alpha/beta hydrolase [Neorhizobium sp. P12A]KAA0689182.1 alpha/beta hydrolase [Neorhizobium sp. P12A]